MLEKIRKHICKTFHGGRSKVLKIVSIRTSKQSKQLNEIWDFFILHSEHRKIGQITHQVHFIPQHFVNFFNPMHETALYYTIASLICVEQTTRGNYVLSNKSWCGVKKMLLVCYFYATRSFFEQKYLLQFLGTYIYLLTCRL